MVYSSTTMIRTEIFHVTAKGTMGLYEGKMVRQGGGSGNPNLPSAQTNYDSPSQSVHWMNKISKIIGTFI